MNKYQILDLIGIGSEGTVYIVREKTPPNNLFAMKEIIIKTPNDVKKSINEIIMMKSVKDKRFVKCHDFYIHKSDDCNNTVNSLYIIMDLYPMDLSNWIERHYSKNDKPVDENVVRNFIVQICSSLYVLHKNNMMHRDIKPSNIFVKENGKDNYELFIGDFGCATYFMKKKSKRRFCGTLNYMAIEVLQGKKYYKMVDLFSVGCCAYNLMTGDRDINLPFEILNNGTKILEEIRINLERNYSKELVEVIVRMINIIPEARPEADEVINLLKT